MSTYVMNENEKFDVFIAYYGNSQNGSEQAAKALYESLNGADIGIGRGVRVYFHPITNPHGPFEETPMIVARTPMFLLVTDKRIPRNEAKQLARHREDGTLRNLFEEVQAFHNSYMYKKMGGDSAAKLFITDDFDRKEAEALHTIFSGKTSLDTYEDVKNWISHFYNNIYIKRILEECKRLASRDKVGFFKGDWVKDANEVWKCSRHEAIGRALLAYYCGTAESSGISQTEKILEIYTELSKQNNLEAHTLKVLEKVKEKFLSNNY